MAEVLAVAPDDGAGGTEKPECYEWGEGDLVHVESGPHRGRRGFVARVYPKQGNQEVPRLAVLVAGYLRTVRMGPGQVTLLLGRCERTERRP